MQISRYLDVRAFHREAEKLRAISGYLGENVLERLEQQRSLIPRMRLRYPDEVVRRWWLQENESHEVKGLLEPDGARWDAACALREARLHHRWQIDPSVVPHPLDDPEPRFLPFIERPAELPFVPWKDHHVAINVNGAEPIYHRGTVVTYYSSWQLLQYAEVVDMGVMSFMNLLTLDDWPSAAEIAAAPRSMSFKPVHAMRGFQEHANTLDAIVWFAEEADLGYHFATRREYRRRLISKEEGDDITRTQRWAMEQTLSRHEVGPDQLLAAIRFLCEQWTHWEREGRPLIAGAYKSVVAQGVRLARLATGMTADEYSVEVGQIGGYFKPILDVMWPDWAAGQRDDARRILVSCRRDKAVLQAQFSDELIDRFLDFIDANGLHGFYWRLDSFHRHAFKGNPYSLEGLKGDVQGMSVVLEHIALALGARRLQLLDKFKELWARNSAVLKLLKNNNVMRVGLSDTIDLDWFEARNNLSLPEQTAADLAICYAIRGGAHRVIEETNPLRLERMMLIMLRAAVKTFEEVKGP
jgi:hypothetical protein